jgi:hypothetical protein
VDNSSIDELMVSTLERVKGIVKAAAFVGEDRRRIMEIEEDAEKRSLMGLGKVVNAGVREVLKCARVYAALNNMEFDWGCHATLVLKKGDEIVGQEVRDDEMIARLSNQKNVWFMHKHFAVYKDKMSFPQDIMQKICYFEIPCLPAQWCVMEDNAFQCDSIIYATPCTPCDIFLKEKYFNGLDEKGTGTILVGIES